METKKKLVKTNNPSTKTKSVTKNESTELVEDYYVRGEYNPYSLKKIESIANDIIPFFENDPKHLLLSQYYRFKRVPESTFYRWVKTYPWFEDKVEQAKRIIGEKKYIGVLNNQMNSKLVMHVLHQYDPNYAKANQYWSEMKKSEESDKPTNITIVKENLDPEYLEWKAMKARDENRNEDSSK